MPLFLSTLSLRRATVRKNQVLLQYSRFLSTLSLRRATDGRNAISPVICISIHALLAESDHYTYRLPPAEAISIHALLAESDGRGCFYFLLPSRFLSTLSLRRATSPAMQILTSRLEFLSTLSLRRATHPLAILSNSHTDFYPRSPCGERRVEWRNKPQVSAISIHALLAESDILSSQCHPNI